MRAFIGAFLLLACNRGNPGQKAASPTPRDSLWLEVSESSGLRFRHEAGNRGIYSMRESMGSGVALFDFDNDGDLDAYLLNGRPLGMDQADSGAFRNRLFRQDSGFRFADVTDAAGAFGNGFAMGVAAADFDNDGWTDLYVSNHGRDSYFRNNGDGTFRDQTEMAGLKDSAWGASVAVLDYDRDGDLDVFVAVYGRIDDSTSCADAAGRKDYCGPESLEPLPGMLLRNEGGRFADVTQTSGIASKSSKGLGAIPLDVDRDGFMDIYVANDGQPNFLWMNQGDGTFREEALAYGVAVNALGKAEAGMGIAVGDVDGDGWEDLYITHLRLEWNKLYRSRPGAGFYDDTKVSGASEKSFPYTGFGTAFFDMDLDGDLDLAAVNGRVTRWDALVKSDPPSFWDEYAEPDLLYENLGQGKFREISDRASAFSGPFETGRALAVGDVDNDGRPDLLVTHGGGKARLLLNRIPSQGHFLALSLLDKRGRWALGARAEFSTPSGFRATRVCRISYGYLASHDPRVFCAIPKTERMADIAVIWPDGKREHFKAASNAFHILKQGTGAPAPSPEGKP